MEQTPELRNQNNLADKQLKDAQDLNMLLHTMLQVVEKDHGIPCQKSLFASRFQVGRPKKLSI